MSIFRAQLSDNLSDEKIKEYNEWNRKLSQQNNREIYRPINVSKIKEDLVPIENGKMMLIKPAEIAYEVKVLLDEMRRDPQYEFCKPYIQKPVIWTYALETACTEGIRIYMSPVFAHTLIHLRGNYEAEAYWGKLSKEEQNSDKCIKTYNMLRTRHVKYVILHEIYHIVYNHVRRGILKYGGNPSELEKTTGNISMDLEINRDIEGSFPELRGCTEIIEGIWWKDEKFYSSAKKPFKKEIWEDIWDDFMESHKNFKTSNPFTNDGANPMQESEKQVGPYAEGWDKAIKSITDKSLDPRTFNFDNIDNSLSNPEIMKGIDKILTALKNEEK